jgi:hypothetical protein
MNAFRDRGNRLEIKQGNGQEPERSLGGWCLEAVVDQIADILEENAKVEPPSQRDENHGN